MTLASASAAAFGFVRARFLLSLQLSRLEDLAAGSPCEYKGETRGVADAGVRLQFWRPWDGGGPATCVVFPILQVSNNVQSGSVFVGLSQDRVEEARGVSDYRGLYFWSTTVQYCVTLYSGACYRSMAIGQRCNCSVQVMQPCQCATSCEVGYSYDCRIHTSLMNASFSTRAVRPRIRAYTFVQNQPECSPVLPVLPLLMMDARTSWYEYGTIWIRWIRFVL